MIDIFVKNEIEKAILRTLVYGDLFDYPLYRDELWKFLINKEIDKESFLKFIKSQTDNVYCKNNLYCLIGREKIIRTRIERKKESQKKIVIAKRIIKRLTFLPTIQFIGISGALSLRNSGKEDDIDLFVITLKGSLWFTRLLMVILLMLMGRYRRRNQSQVSNKICLNMLIDDGALVFPKTRQDLYTAHEIVQLMPIFDRNDIYKKFIIANKWVEKFLPNAFRRGITQIKTLNNAESFISVFLHYVFRFSALEHFAKVIQLRFIKKHFTIETISDHFLAFHPLDYKEKVLNEYKKRLKLCEV